MEIEIALKNMTLDVAIKYRVWPAEPEVRYTPNGDGHPGSPAELEIEDVEVRSVYGETYLLNLSSLSKGGWWEDLNHLAWEYVEKDIAENGWISWMILQEVEAAHEEW